VAKDAFPRWVEDAKKKFARRDSGGDAVRIAAAPEVPDGTRSAPAGN